MTKISNEQNEQNEQIKATKNTKISRKYLELFGFHLKELLYGKLRKVTIDVRFCSL